MLFNKVFIIFSLPLFFLCSTFRFAAGAAVNIKVIAYPYEISAELFDFFFAERFEHRPLAVVDRTAYLEIDVFRLIGQPHDLVSLVRRVGTGAEKAALLHARDYADNRRM